MMAATDSRNMWERSNYKLCNGWE